MRKCSTPRGQANRSAVLLALMLLPAYSAVLSVPNQVASPGQVVIASSAFSSEGQPISGLQFDLQWDQAFDLKLVIGDQLIQSSKVLFTASIGPRTLRCLIVGMNKDVLPDGQLFKAFLVIDPQAAPGLAKLAVNNTVATDPNGNSLPLGASFTDVQIQNGVPITVGLASTGVLNAASLIPGPVSPGEIVTLLGNLPNAQPLLFFNGIPAPVLYAGLNQVNGIVPFGLAPDAPASLEVRTRSGSVTLPVSVAPVAPAIFAQGNTGMGQGAILNQDFTTNSPSNPARRGSIVMLYGTGFGMLDPQPADGKIADRAAVTRLGVTASVAGISAEVTYAGGAPGLIAGVVQVNLRVPDSVPPSLAAPISLTIGQAVTPSVTVAIQ
jgi:uncharacterized protein (TIGR03437 family)